MSFIFSSPVNGSLTMLAVCVELDKRLIVKTLASRALYREKVALWKTNLKSELILN